MPFIIPKDLQPFCMTLGVPTEFGTCKYQMLLVLTNHQHRVVPVPLITALPRQDPTLVVVEATAVDRYAHGLKKGEGLFVREKRQRGREEEREREREREILIVQDFRSTPCIDSILRLSFSPLRTCCATAASSAETLLCLTAT